MSVHNKYTGYTLKHLFGETYVQLAATDANVLRAQALRSETSYGWMLSGQVLTGNCSLVCVVSCVCVTLYCVVTYILLV